MVPTRRSTAAFVGLETAAVVARAAGVSQSAVSLVGLAVLDASHPFYGLVVVEIPEPGLRSILVDTARAMASVVGHLADLGHHEIGYFSADYPSAAFARRFRHRAQAARRRDPT